MRPPSLIRMPGSALLLALGTSTWLASPPAWADGSHDEDHRVEEVRPSIPAQWRFDEGMEAALIAASYGGYGIARFDRARDRAVATDEALAFGGRTTFARFDPPERSWALEAELSFGHDEMDQTQLRLQGPNDPGTAVDVRRAVTGLGLSGHLNAALGRGVGLSVRLNARAFAHQIDDRMFGVDALEKQSGTIGSRGGRSAGSALHLGPTLLVDWHVSRQLRAFAGYESTLSALPAARFAAQELAPFAVTHGGDVGVQLTLSPSFDATVRGFALHVPEAMDRPWVTGRTTRAGGAMAMTASPTDALGAEMSAIFTHSFDDAPSPVPGAPIVELRAALDAELPLGRFASEDFTLRCNLAASVLGPRPFPDSAATTVLTDVSATVSVGVASFGVELTNLFDGPGREGELVYASASDDAQRGMFARQLTQAEPFTAQAVLTLDL